MHAPAVSRTLAPRDLAAFQRKLLAWFAEHRRELPWRESQDPYRVWISEIMLQQTQVATVKDYFRRFVAEFPTVAHLAAAPEENVLRLWEGLGYYRRARQLHAAAQEVMGRFEGQFPSDVASLQSLPGVGRYTAGAIASIAFDQPAPILEANTQRLYARLLAWDQPLATSSSQKVLWQFAESIVPRQEPGHFNQALMELGSLVCTPKSPDCARCPIKPHCRAWEQGRQHELPRPKKKTLFIPVTEVALVVRRKDQILLRQCGLDERWAGLWDFPRFALPEGTDDVTPAAEMLRNAAGIEATWGQHLTTIKHGVTRYRITLLCHEMTYEKGRLNPQPGPEGEKRVWRWTELQKLGELPLSTTGRKLARLVAPPKRV